MQLLIKSLGKLFFFQHITALLKIDGGWRAGGLEGRRVGGLEGWRVGGWRAGGLEARRAGRSTISERPKTFKHPDLNRSFILPL